MSGRPCFPSAGSYLDQDAELMLAFELIDTIMKDIETAREARKKNQEAAKNQ